MDALLNSGMDVPVRKRSRLPLARLAKHNARHRLWKNAERIKSPNYTVRTNAGHELAVAVSQAMEQMNRYYRQVFQHKTRGGGTARCEISI